MRSSARSRVTKRSWAAWAAAKSTGEPFWTTANAKRSPTIPVSAEHSSVLPDFAAAHAAQDRFVTRLLAELRS